MVFPDLDTATQIDRGDHVRAIGWPKADLPLGSSYGWLRHMLPFDNPQPLMVPRLAGFVVALTVVIAGAQAGAQTPQALPDTQIPSVIPLPPAFDRVLRDYEAAWGDGDGPRLAALFTEDGFAGVDEVPTRER